jgi:hypothetical protein
VGARAWWIRIAVAVAAVLSLWVALSPSAPSKVPDYALGSPWILRGEWGLATLLLLLILITVIWRGLVSGQLPLEISREGVKYEAATELVQTGTEAVTEEVNEAIDELREAIAKVSEAVEDVADATSDAIRIIDSKIEDIEKDLRE